jgi:hypothetical protein
MADMIRAESTAATDASALIADDRSTIDATDSPWLAALLHAALVVIGVTGVCAWLVLAFFHIGDRYRVGHVQGHWMAMARYANEGILYPPLAREGRFGGTRYMPLPIAMNAAASRATGEYLTSGKAVGIALFASLLVLVLIVLRRVDCPWTLAVALTGLLPATNTGVLVGSTVGGDALPVVLQIAALLVVTSAVRQKSATALIVAGILAGLATCSKLTGIWAALAVFTWLGVRREWRYLVWFVAGYASTVTLTLGMIQWASEGRFLTTLLTLAFAGTGPVHWIRAPNQLVFFGIKDATAVWMVAPFAILGTVAQWRSRTATVYHHALGWSLLFTLVVFTDIGAGLNQLIDPAVLTVIAVGSLAVSLPLERLGTVSLTTALILTVGWAGLTGVRGVVPDLGEVASAVRTGQRLQKYNPRPLAGAVGRGDTLLAEDPSIPVLLGRVPVVLDPFMLRRLDEVQPAAVDTFITRIERKEFDHVALIVPLEGEDFWWRYYHFGPRIVTALRKTYVLTGQVDGYYLYRPAHP